MTGSKEQSRKFREANPSYTKDYYAAHASASAESSRRQKSSRRRVLDALKSRPCMDCGGSFSPECMDFDHRPSEIKLFSIGSQPRRAWALVLLEIDKCDLVCANCHRTRTKARGYTKHHHNVQLPI